METQEQNENELMDVIFDFLPKHIQYKLMSNDERISYLISTHPEFENEIMLPIVKHIANNNELPNASTDWERQKQNKEE